ncbi:PQ-loop domain-containing transporter [Mycoplasmopsis mustelae]|nr:PQ-loop domain-containing transporter [Mycoplasmopsis mustelae]
MSTIAISIVVFSWIAAAVVASLGIPQLISLLKHKKTGNVNFASFWIFQTGILLWIIWSSLGHKNLLNAFVANSISIVFYSIMIYLLYHYKQEFGKKQKFLAAAGLSIYLIIWIIFIILNQTLKFRWSTQTQLILGLIFPSLTTLAFFPQLIYSFKKNEWKGISYWMFLVYEINNIVWIIFWILNIVSTEEKQAFIGGLVWQIISFILFGIQFTFTLRDHILTKKKSVIETDF